jgi:hypothetical protein
MAVIFLRFRDFGIFKTRVSTSYPPICRNGEILTCRLRRSHDETSHLFGILDFATSRIHMLCSWISDSQNPEMVNKGLTFVSTSVPPVHSQMDGPDSLRNFATREVEGLPLLNPDVCIPDREDLVTRVLPIGRLRFSRYFGTSHLASIDAKVLTLQLANP